MVLKEMLNPDGSCFECGKAIPEGTLRSRKAKHKHRDSKVYGSDNAGCYLVGNSGDMWSTVHLEGFNICRY